MLAVRVTVRPMSVNMMRSATVIAAKRLSSTLQRSCGVVSTISSMPFSSSAVQLATWVIAMPAKKMGKSRPRTTAI